MGTTCTRSMRNGYSARAAQKCRLPAGERPARKAGCSIRQEFGTGEEATNRLKLTMSTGHLKRLSESAGHTCVKDAGERSKASRHFSWMPSLRCEGEGRRRGCRGMGQTNNEATRIHRGKDDGMSARRAAGVDGQTFEDIEAYGVERWAGELAEALRSKTYRPNPLWRAWMRKPGLEKSCLPFGSSFWSVASEQHLTS